MSHPAQQVPRLTFMRPVYPDLAQIARTIGRGRCCDNVTEGRACRRKDAKCA